MLRVFGQSSRLCDGITRREVLRVGGLAFGGLTLADVLRERASAGAGTGRGKSVIMIWLRGGPSHIDSYDMKPDAPAEIRGEFRADPRPTCPAFRSASTCRCRRRSWTSWPSCAASSRTTWATTRRTTSSPACPIAASGPAFGGDRQPPAAADGRPAAVRQPDVQAAGPVRQRRPGLPRPGPPAVRAARRRGWRT